MILIESPSQPISGLRHQLIKLLDLSQSRQARTISILFKDLQQIVASTAVQAAQNSQFSQLALRQWRHATTACLLAG